jgi:hypothetical protein
MSSPISKYSFLPWVKIGLGTSITNDEKNFHIYINSVIEYFHN